MLRDWCWVSNISTVSPRFSPRGLIVIFEIWPGGLFERGGLFEGRGLIIRTEISHGGLFKTTTFLCIICSFEVFYHPSFFRTFFTIMTKRYFNPFSRGNFTIYRSLALPPGGLFKYCVIFILSIEFNQAPWGLIRREGAYCKKMILHGGLFEGRAYSRGKG